jgi:hypothetical protein
MLRLTVVALASFAATALAQTTDDIPAPPLVTVDGTTPGEAPAAQPQYQQPAPNPYQQPAQPQYQQPAPNSYQQPAQPQYQQPAPNQYQQPAQPQYQQPAPNQYQQPAQQYQPDPQYQQPAQQTPQYRNAPLPPEQQEPQPAAQKKSRTDGFHLGVFAFGSVGVVGGSTGLIGGVRGEMDISRFALHVAYNRFYSPGFEANQLTSMIGVSLMANDAGRIRVLGGLDVIGTPTATAFGPVVALNFRLGLGVIGFDGSAALTLLPFRQLDARAALVLRLAIFELHAGWRFQVLDGTDGGAFTTSFLSSPSVNGPYAALGLAF